MTKITAKLVPYSSMVGSSIMLLDGKKCIVILPILVQYNIGESHKDASEKWAKFIVDKINKE